MNADVWQLCYIMGVLLSSLDSWWVWSPHTLLKALSLFSMKLNDSIWPCCVPLARACGTKKLLFLSQKMLL